MKRLLVTLLALLPTIVSAQQLSNRHWQEIKKTLSPAGFLRAPVYVTARLPACGSTNQGAYAYDDTLNKFAYCDGTGWVYDFIDWPLLAPDGSSTAPSYSFANSPTSGMWLDPFGLDFLTLAAAPAPAGTDTSGSHLQLGGGTGRGIGTGGHVFIYVTPPGVSSGSSFNPTQTVLNASGTDGSVTFGGLDVGTGAPGTSTWAGADRAAGVTDAAGGALNIDTGVGTGTGAGGLFQVRVAPAAAAGGSVQNALQNALQISAASGTINIGGLDMNVAPSSSTWGAADVVAGISNTSGAGLFLRSGSGTGNAPLTSISFLTPDLLGSGTVQQGNTTRLAIGSPTSIWSNGVHVSEVGTAPTVSACGTTPSAVTGSDHAGRLTTGSGGTLQSCTLTFNTAFSATPVCVANDETQILLLRAVPTTTALVIDCTGAGCLESDIITYICRQGS